MWSTESSLILLLVWLNLINSSRPNLKIQFTVKVFPTFSHPTRYNHLFSHHQNTQITTSMHIYYNINHGATEWHICVYSSGRLWEHWSMGLSINHLLELLLFSLILRKEIGPQEMIHRHLLGEWLTPCLRMAPSQSGLSQNFFKSSVDFCLRLLHYILQD